MTSSSTYPASLDTFNVAIDGTKTLADGTQKHSEVHDKIGDALNKIESELGVNPAQAAATVTAFLAAIPTANLAGLDTDTSLTADSDAKFPSQKAVKAYADAITATGVGTMAWTPYTPATITGWAATPTVACQYLRIGAKTVILNYSISGTSNDVTVGFSLPALGGSSASRQYLAAGDGEDNGVFIGAVAIVAQGSSGVAIQTTDHSAWTSSGVKYVSGQIIYELA